MTDPTPEMVALALKCVENSRIAGPLGLGPPNARAAALAAIIETSGMAAKLADTLMGVDRPSVFGGALRAYDHIKPENG